MGIDDRSERALDRIADEIAAEKFAALKRIATTLETLIADLDRIGRAAAGAGNECDREDLAAAHEDLRRRALEWRWYLDVQREVMGLRPHRLVDEIFAVPGPLRQERSRPLVSRLRSPVNTEGGDAPGAQGARRAHTGRM